MEGGYEMRPGEYDESYCIARKHMRWDALGTTWVGATTRKVPIGTGWWRAKVPVFEPVPGNRDQ